MRLTVRLLNGQEIRFDNHTRGMVTSFKGLHFHKIMKDNADKKLAGAEILIYLDGSYNWKPIGKNSDRLDRELKNVFKEMPKKDIFSFVEQMSGQLEKFYNHPTTDKEKADIRDNIIRSFYGESNLEIVSSKMKQYYNINYTTLYITENKKLYQFKFIEGDKYSQRTNNGDYFSKKSIIIKDITENRTKKDD